MMRRFSLALLAVVFGAGLAAADQVKKEVKEGAQDTKDAVKEGAKDVGHGVKKGAKATKNEVRDDVKGAFHDADGVVKSVSANGFVLTDDKGQELSFEVNNSTIVRATGATHKMNALRADGKPAQLSEFLSEGRRVSVRYSKPEDRMVAKDIRVKP